MSYILDALKRSEQERHQGELIHPTIDTIMLKAKPVKHQWWPYLLIAVLMINVGVYLYFQFSQSRVVQEEGIQQQTADTPSGLNTATPLFSNEASGINTAVVDVPSVKALPTHVLQTPNPNKYYDLNQIRAGSQEKASTANSKQDSPVTSSNLNSFSSNSKQTEFNDEGMEVIRPKNYSAAEKSVMPEAEIKQEVVSESLPAQNIPENFELIEPTREMPQTSQLPAPEIPETQSAVPASASTYTDPFENIQHLNDLPVAFQKNVPNIRFNSHIYSDQPAERRVIINDLYLREGQSFSGMKIITIGEFYIELEKQGQSFKLPVLRDWFTPG